MKRIVILLGVLGFFAALFPLEYAFGTEFDLVLVLRNKGNSWKRLMLTKGRVLELAGIDKSHYQSIILSEGDGLVLIPPHQTVQRRVKGLCMHKGLAFPPEGVPVSFTPFTAKEELIDKSQAEVHRVAASPAPNMTRIIAKGFSNEKKDGQEIDRDEAFRNAVENAAREGGMEITSETVLRNLNLIRNYQRIRIKQHSVKLGKIVHEEYDNESGR